MINVKEYLARTFRMVINLFSILEILFVYAIAYIFEYGYKIQKDSKGVMYS